MSNVYQSICAKRGENPYEISKRNSYTNAEQCKMYGNLFVTKKGENTQKIRMGISSKKFV